MREAPQMTIYMPLAMQAQLQAASRRRNLSASAYMRELLRRDLENQAQALPAPLPHYPANTLPALGEGD